MGVEAVYWEKPSILAGMCFYRELGCTYNPETHVELMEMLGADLEPKDREPAIMFGYYLLNFGIKLKDTVVSNSGRKAVFKGKNLNGNPLHAFTLQCLRKLKGTAEDRIAKGKFL